MLTHAARAAAKPLVAARGAREGLWLEQIYFITRALCAHLSLTRALRAHGAAPRATIRNEIKQLRAIKIKRAEGYIYILFTFVSLRPCYGPLFLSRAKRAQEKRDHNMGACFTYCDPRAAPSATLRVAGASPLRSAAALRRGSRA